MAYAKIVYLDPYTGDALLRIGSKERWYGHDRKPLDTGKPGSEVMRRYRLRLIGKLRDFTATHMRRSLSWPR